MTVTAALPNVYVDLAEVPSDSPPPDLGDGGIVPAPPGAQPTRRLAAVPPESLAPASQANLLVPFTRLIKAGSTGTDVRGVKRAIWRADGLAPSLGFTPVFGPIAVRKLQEFQHRVGLHADGQVGPETLRKLGPYFDRYAFFLYEGYAPGLAPADALRQRTLAYLVWGYNNRPQLHYIEARPMTLLNDLEHLPDAEDCSTFYTKAAKYGGWRDPNGQRPPYNGIGNTTTLIANGRRITRSSLRVGDGVFYWDPAHVGGYVGGGRIISHGSEAGPSLTPIDYRSDFAQCRTYL